MLLRFAVSRGAVNVAPCLLRCPYCAAACLQRRAAALLGICTAAVS